MVPSSAIYESACRYRHVGQYFSNQQPRVRFHQVTVAPTGKLVGPFFYREWEASTMKDSENLFKKLLF